MSREDDKKIISDIPREKIPDFIFMHLRNMWSIDGLYFLGIEDRELGNLMLERTRLLTDVA